MHNYFITLLTAKLAKKLLKSKTISLCTSFFNNYCAKDLTTSGNILYIRLRGGLSLLHKHFLCLTVLVLYWKCFFFRIIV